MINFLSWIEQSANCGNFLTRTLTGRCVTCVKHTILKTTNLNKLEIFWIILNKVIFKLKTGKII